MRAARCSNTSATFTSRPFRWLLAWFTSPRFRLFVFIMVLGIIYAFLVTMRRRTVVALLGSGFQLNKLPVTMCVLWYPATALRCRHSCSSLWREFSTSFTRSLRWRLAVALIGPGIQYRELDFYVFFGVFMPV